MCVPPLLCLGFSLYRDSSSGGTLRGVAVIPSSRLLLSLSAFGVRSPGSRLLVLRGVLALLRFYQAAVSRQSRCHRPFVFSTPIQCPGRHFVVFTFDHPLVCVPLTFVDHLRCPPTSSGPLGAIFILSIRLVFMARPCPVTVILALSIDRFSVARTCVLCSARLLTHHPHIFLHLLL